jgi:hypothetical protein
MSALGHKRTLHRVRLMSALPPRADIIHDGPDVRFVPKADISPTRYSITSSALASAFMPRRRSLNRSDATVDFDLIGEGSPAPTQDNLPHYDSGFASQQNLHQPANELTTFQTVDGGSCASRQSEVPDVRFGS